MDVRDVDQEVREITRILLCDLGSDEKLELKTQRIVMTNGLVFSHLDRIKEAICKAYGQKGQQFNFSWRHATIDAKAPTAGALVQRKSDAAPQFTRPLPNPWIGIFTETVREVVIQAVVSGGPRCTYMDCYRLTASITYFQHSDVGVVWWPGKIQIDFQGTAEPEPSVRGYYKNTLFDMGHQSSCELILKK